MSSPPGLWWAQQKCYADARGNFEFIGWTDVRLVEVRENEHAEDGFEVFGMGWDIPSPFKDTRLIRRVEDAPKEVEFPVVR